MKGLHVLFLFGILVQMNSVAAQGAITFNAVNPSEKKIDNLLKKFVTLQSRVYVYVEAMVKPFHLRNLDEEKIKKICSEWDRREGRQFVYNPNPENKCSQYEKPDSNFVISRIENGLKLRTLPLTDWKENVIRKIDEIKYGIDRVKFGVPVYLQMCELSKNLTLCGTDIDNWVTRKLAEIESKFIDLSDKLTEGSTISEQAFRDYKDYEDKAVRDLLNRRKNYMCCMENEDYFHESFCKEVEPTTTIKTSTESENKIHEYSTLRPRILPSRIRYI